MGLLTDCTDTIEQQLGIMHEAMEAREALLQGNAHLTFGVRVGERTFGVPMTPSQETYQAAQDEAISAIGYQVASCWDAIYVAAQAAKQHCDQAKQQQEQAAQS